MADLGLDVEALRRDRDRYQGLLLQAEEQISAWNERADSVQQAIGGIDQLLALADADVATDAGPARQLLPGRGVAPNTGTTRPAASPRKKPAQPARKPAAKPTHAPDPSESPSAGSEHAPEPDEGSAPGIVVAPDAPKGTDAVRIVLEGAPERSFTLAELLSELEGRHWLAPSRRPEELVRINLKRLAERGGALRTDDGRWKASGSTTPAPGSAGDADPQTRTEAPALLEAPTDPRTSPVDPPPVVGSTVREW